MFTDPTTTLRKTKEKTVEKDQPGQTISPKIVLCHDTLFNSSMVTDARFKSISLKVLQKIMQIE